MTGHASQKEQNGVPQLISVESLLFLILNSKKYSNNIYYCSIRSGSFTSSKWIIEFICMPCIHTHKYLDGSKWSLPCSRVLLSSFDSTLTRSLFVINMMCIMYLLNAVYWGAYMRRTECSAKWDSVSHRINIASSLQWNVIPSIWCNWCSLLRASVVLWVTESLWACIT